MSTKKYNIVVVDDHKLYRSGLVQLIHAIDIQVNHLHECSNGQEFLNYLKSLDHIVPDIVLMDIDMPELNGFQTMEKLAIQKMNVPVLVITMMDEEPCLLRMIRLGARGFLSKDIEPEELRKAIETIANKGFHFTERFTGKLMAAVRGERRASTMPILSEREQQFIQYCSTELTYKEIANKMCVSPKTVDGYRAGLFQKLDVKSRVGLVMYAVKNGFVSLA